MSKDENLRRRNARISDRQRLRKRKEEETPTPRVAPIARQGRVASTIGESLLPEFEERAKTKIRSTDPKYLTALKIGAKRGILSKSEEQEYMFAVTEGVVKPYKGDKYGHLYNKAVEVRESNRVRDFGLTDNELDTLSASQQGKWGDRGLTGLREFQNSTTFGSADMANAAALDVDRNDNSVLQSTREAARLMRDRGVKDYKLQATRMTRGAARKRNPYSAMAGEGLGYLAPGAGGMMATTGVARFGARRLGLSTMSRNASPVGINRVGRIGRYAKDVLPRAAAGGAVDGAIYGQTVGRSNMEAEEVRDIGMFSDEANKLMGDYALLGGAIGVAASPAWRGLRAGYTAAGDRGFLPMMRKGVDGKTTFGRQVTPLDQRPQSWSQRFTPVDRRAEVMFEDMQRTGTSLSDAQYMVKAFREGRAADAEAMLKPAYTKAMIMIEKRLAADNIPIERLENKLREMDYNGENVSEFFFEIAALAGSGKTQSLANALATVSGEARTTATRNFDNRSFDAFEALKRSMNKAFNIDGTNYYHNLDDLKARGKEQVSAAYDHAVKNGSLKDETWADISDVENGVFSRPSVREALRQSETLAGDAGKGAEARELKSLNRAYDDYENARNVVEDEQLKGADGDQGKIDKAQAAMLRAQDRIANMKPTVAAFKFIDEQLTKIRFDANAPGSNRNATGVAQAQDDLRLKTDDETLLEPARDLNTKFETAERAYKEGVDMFSQGTDIETLLTKFQRQIEKYDGADPEILPALLNAFVRGAENAMSTAGGIGTVLRRLYGSPRSRQKLVEMLNSTKQMAKDAGENTRSMTMSQRALLGGKRPVTKLSEDGSGAKFEEDVVVPGRISREIAMQDSKNQTTRGSQTATRLNDISQQEVFEDTAEQLARDAAQAAQGGLLGLAVRYGAPIVGRVFRSGIYDSATNRELGDIMFTGGKEHLNRTIDNLKRVRDARMGKGELDNLDAPTRAGLVGTRAPIINVGGNNGNGNPPPPSAPPPGRKRTPPSQPQGPRDASGRGPKRIPYNDIQGPPTPAGDPPLRISARTRVPGQNPAFRGNERGMVSLDTAGGLAGATGGFLGATDMDGDGEISLAERFGAAAIGGVGGYMGVRMIRDPKFRGNEIGAVGERITVEGMSDGVGNKHGLMPHLRIKSAFQFSEDKPKAKLLQTTNAVNADKQLAELDGILDRHPDGLSSPEGWANMMAEALGSDDVPVAPYALIRDVQDGTAKKTIASLSPGQIADADHGFNNARRMNELYTSGVATPADTGLLFAWGFLSRGVSPYTQEGLFMDAFEGLPKWIDDANNGRFDLDAYLEWAQTAAPKGSGQPGSGASHNLNAFGKDFLRKMSQPAPGSNKTKLEYLHDLMSDPTMTGPQIRREFARIGTGVGIDNKVVSFTLLVSGRDDVMVLDRVQVRKLWNDGRFDGVNLYDGYKADDKVVTGSALSNLTYGARGLLVYEAIERKLAQHLNEIYAGTGREDKASIGRYHWETWVADSQQEASHGTLDAVLRRMEGDANPMQGVVAKEGEYGAYSYGAQYGRDNGVPFIDYPVPGGGTYRMSPAEFGEFREAIKAPKSGVVPKKFKVSDAGDQPWYNNQAVNQQRLDEIAGRFGRRIDDERSVQAANGGAGPVGQAANGRPDDLAGNAGEGRTAPRAKGAPSAAAGKDAGRITPQGVPVPSLVQMDDALTTTGQAVAEKVRSRMAAVDDPRHYGPRMSEYGMPDEVDFNRPLYEQVKNPRMAAGDIADAATMSGGEPSGAMATQYVGRVRRARDDAADQTAARADVIATRAGATRELNQAQSKLDAFFGVNGEHTAFKTQAKKRSEYIRRVKAVDDADAKAAATKKVPGTEGPATPPRAAGKFPDDRREDMIQQEINRAERPLGYKTVQETVAERTGADKRRVDDPDQAWPVISNPRTRPIGRRRPAIDNRSTEMLLDPAMAAEGQRAATGSAGGFAVSRRVGRVVGYGMAATAAGGVYGAIQGVEAMLDYRDEEKRLWRESIEQADDFYKGQLETGNIDLTNRPSVKNPDGTISTVRTISIGTDRGEVVIPTVHDDGYIMSDDEAIAHYHKTGRHFGIFDNPDNATAFAHRLHLDQAAMMPDNQWSKLDYNNRHRIQVTLNRYLKRQLNLDAGFGPDTEASLREFQRQVGLRETGVLDTETLKRLNLLHEKDLFLFELQRRNEDRALSPQ